MKLSEIIQHAKGTVLNPSIFVNDYEIVGGCGADLMSDVLASAKPGAVLLTGLCNPQVVRTAQMADMRAIIFLRGKQPSSEIIELATNENIPLISSEMGMFELCGRLYKAGLHSYESNWIGFHE
jgi:predicted transcriptional regulator